MHAELRRQSVVRVLKNEIGIHICSWLTFGSRIRRSKLWFSLLFNAWASNRRRARSTRANVGLSIIDGGARLWSPELGSIVTNIVAWTLLSLRSFSFSYSFYFGIQKKKHNTKKMSTKIVAYPPVFCPLLLSKDKFLVLFFPRRLLLINDPNVHDTRTHQWSGFVYTPQWLPMIITYDVHDE